MQLLNDEQFGSKQGTSHTAPSWRLGAIIGLASGAGCLTAVREQRG